MKRPFWKRAARMAAATTALAFVALGMGTSGYATQTPKKLSAGNAALGFMTMPIYRGGAVPDEFLVKATPSNCGAPVQVTYTWNEQQNWMKLRLKGKHVLDKLPSIQRTEGVNFFSNPFWPEATSFDNGRYQFWTISALGTATFYYDGQTLDLLGSNYDFPSPPANSIPLELPIFAALPTPFFQPDHHGNIDVEVVYQYDHLVRPDLPQYTHTVGSFIPHTLCKANPYRYDLTTTRPYAITLPASEAKSFRQYLENGLIFDMTIEPPAYHTFPPITTMAGVYNGAAGLAGGVPRGWTLDLEAYFGGLAPPLRPLPSAPFAGESCTDYFKPKRDRSFDVCQQGGN